MKKEKRQYTPRAKKAKRKYTRRTVQADATVQAIPQLPAAPSLREQFVESWLVLCLFSKAIHDDTAERDPATVRRLDNILEHRQLEFVNAAGAYAAHLSRGRPTTTTGDANND